LRPWVRFPEMVTNESVIAWYERVDCPSGERVQAWINAECEEIVRRSFLPDCAIRADQWKVSTRGTGKPLLEVTEIVGIYLWK
jgi:hypothetical protein